MPYTMSDKAREARRKGGKARAKQFTHTHQQQAGKARGDSMTPEELTRLGQQGYKAMVKKHGRDKAIEIIRNYQLANPSKLEQFAAEIFTKLGVSYEAQIQAFNDRGILIDYVVNGVYIDVQGYWHDHNPRAIERDLYVAERMAFMGKRYIALHHRDISDWERIIRTALGIEP